MDGYTVIMLDKKPVLALKRLLANLKFHPIAFWHVFSWQSAV